MIKMVMDTQSETEGSMTFHPLVDPFVKRSTVSRFLKHYCRSRAL